MGEIKIKTICPKCSKEMQRVGVHKPVYVCMNRKCKTKVEQLTLF